MPDQSQLEHARDLAQKCLLWADHLTKTAKNNDPALRRAQQVFALLRQTVGETDAVAGLDTADYGPAHALAVKIAKEVRARILTLLQERFPQSKSWTRSIWAHVRKTIRGCEDFKKNEISANIDAEFRSQYKELGANGSAPEDNTAFVPAKTFIKRDGFPKYLNEITASLNANLWIRRKRPVSKTTGREIPNRLLVHAGDWHKFEQQRQPVGDPFDQNPGLVETTLDEIEGRKAVEKVRKTAGRSQR